MASVAAPPAGAGGGCPCRAAPCPGRGIGLLATENLPRGAVVLRENPLLVVPALSCEETTCAWCLHVCSKAAAPAFCDERCRKAAAECPAFAYFNGARPLARAAAHRFVAVRTARRDAKAKAKAQDKTQPADDVKGKAPIKDDEREADEDSEDGEDSEDDAELTAEDDLRLLVAVAALRCAGKDGHLESKRASIELDRLCAPESVVEALHPRVQNLLAALRDEACESRSVSKKRQRVEEADKAAVVVRNLVGAMGAHVSAATTLTRIHCNCFGVMAHANVADDEDDEKRYLIRGTAVYAKLSRANHDCAPNGARFDAFDGVADECDEGDNRWGRCTAKVVTVRDVQVGEEIVIAYVPLDWGRAERRHRLEGYGFACRCRRCQAEKGGDVDDDDDDDDEGGEEGEEANEHREEDDGTMRTYFELWVERHTCPTCRGTLAPLAPGVSAECCARCARVVDDAEAAFRQRIGAS